MIKSLKFYFLSILLVYFAVANFLTSFFTKFSISDRLTFWLIHWYEPVILLTFLIVAVLLAIKKKLWAKNNILVSLMLLLSLASILFFSSSTSRGIEGFRFTFFPLLLFFVVSNANIEDKLTTKLTNAYVCISLIIAAGAVIERFFPFKYWEIWGILSQNSNFGYGLFAASDKFYQSASIIGAPNQLASFLLPAFFLLIVKVKKANFYSIVSLTTVLLAIALTFSRSAYIGLLAGFIVYLFFINKNKFLKYGFSGVFSVSVIALVFLYQTNLGFRMFSTHGGQTGHQTALNSSLQELGSRLNHHLPNFLLGSGLGSAGPLVIKYGGGIISESWYLQLFLEVGLAGLVLWLVFILVIAKELFERNKLGLFLSLIAVSVTAAFLHTWADNPALSLTLFILIGLALSKEKYGANID